jgi:hypothetical protein
MYKIGDKVKVKTLEELQKEYTTESSGDIQCPAMFICAMRQYCGEIVTISSYWDLGKGPRYHIQEDGGRWNWSDAMFKSVSIPISKIWRR